MVNLKKILFFVICIWGYESFTAEYINKNCFPKTNLIFSTSNKNLDNGLNKINITILINHFKKVMGEVVRDEMGKELKISLDWENGRANIQTTRDDDDNPVINIWGGIIRHPEMNSNGFLAILCHELGHHLGGAPKKFRGRSKKRSWSSAEGQADYYTGLFCLPKVLKEIPKSIHIVRATNNTGAEVDLCRGEEECLQSIQGGVSLGRLFAGLKGFQDMPSLKKEDSTEVKETFYEHGSPQCRLDTIISGLACNARPVPKYDSIDPTIGTCFREKSDLNIINGVRPLCWYHPAKLYRYGGKLKKMISGDR